MIIKYHFSKIEDKKKKRAFFQAKALKKSIYLHLHLKIRVRI